MARVILLCQFIHLFALLFGPTDCELWFTIDLVSEKSIVNTCKMFTLRVNSFAASRPHILSYWVLSLFFSFAVSSTTTTPFLDHVVREREGIQSQFMKLSSVFACNQELSANAVDNSLISTKKTVGTCFFGVISHDLNNSTLPNSRIMAFEFLAQWIVDVVLLQVGLKCFSMKMTFDPLL